MILVADTSPLNYLVQIDHFDIVEPCVRPRHHSRSCLQRINGSPNSPQSADVAVGKPVWLEVRQLAGPLDPTLLYLGPGEQQAIQLAEQLRADAILIDDKQGRAEAAKRNLAVIGTLGVLAAAAEKGFLDLPDAIHRLQQTDFHISPQILQVQLRRDKTVRQEFSAILGGKKVEFRETERAATPCGCVFPVRLGPFGLWCYDSACQEVPRYGVAGRTDAFYSRRLPGRREIQHDPPRVCGWSDLRDDGRQRKS